MKLSERPTPQVDAIHGHAGDTLDLPILARSLEQRLSAAVEALTKIAEWGEEWSTLAKDTLRAIEEGRK